MTGRPVVPRSHGVSHGRLMPAPLRSMCQTSASVQRTRSALRTCNVFVFPLPRRPIRTIGSSSSGTSAGLAARSIPTGNGCVNDSAEVSSG
jgi:hypothetical protein